MKAKIQISGLVALAVIGGAVASDAGAASAVRSLGGVGTYSSAASATSAGTSSATTTGTARASALRVTGTAGKTGTPTTVTTASGGTVGRTAATPRLSVGKLLTGSATAARPVGGSTSGSKPNTATSSEDLNNQIKELSAQIADLRKEVEGFGFADESLAKRIDDLQEQVDGLDGTNIANLSEQVEALATQVDELAKDIGDIDFDALVTIQNDIDDLKDQVAGLDIEKINQGVSDVDVIVSVLGQNPDDIRNNLYSIVKGSPTFSTDVMSVVKGNSDIIYDSVVNNTGFEAKVKNILAGQELPSTDGTDENKVYTIGLVNGTPAWLVVQDELDDADSENN